MKQDELKEAWNRHHSRQSEHTPSPSSHAEKNPRSTNHDRPNPWTAVGRGRGRGCGVTVVADDEGTDLDEVERRLKSAFGRGRANLEKYRHDSSSTSERDTCSSTSSSVRNGEIDMTSLTVGEQVHVRLEAVPEGILESVDTFYVCRSCGRVYWTGSHMPRAQKQFAHVIH